MHFLKKTLSLILTLLLFSLVTYLAFQIIPGDAVTAMLGTEATDEQISAMREELGLDKPILIRYVNWLVGFIQGDLGTSNQYRMPVSTILAEKIPITAVLSVFAFFLVLILSFPLGIIMARYAGRFLESLAVVINQIVMSIPPFFIGIIFSFTFGLMFKWFIPGQFISHEQNPMAFWKYLFFPALAIALPKIAMTVKLLRSSILSETNKPYVRSAYSRGNTRNRALYIHVLRNAMIPVVTFLAMTFSGIIAGSIIIEQVFVIPGIGRLLLVSISNRDLPVVQAIVLLIAFVVIVMNYLADLLCQLIDPRTRMS